MHVIDESGMELSEGYEKSEKSFANQLPDTHSDEDGLEQAVLPTNIL